MTTVKHTPGPWVEEGSGDGKYSNIVALHANSELCEPIAIIPHDDITEEGHAEMFANMSLILAAPQMLMMLEDLDAWLSFRPEVATPNGIERVKKLIAKAKGDTQ